MSDVGQQLRQCLPAAACVGAGALLAYRCWQRTAELPPGPIGLPIVGMLPWLTGDNRHLAIVEICKRYGDLVSFRMGSQLFVVVNSYDFIKEMFESDDFTGKPVTPFTQRFTQGCGIFLNQGASWAFHRRSTLRMLRDFGFARQRSVEMIDSQLDDIQVMLDDVAANKRAIHILDTFAEATNGVIAGLTLNMRLRRGDPDFEAINSATRRFFATPVFLNLPLLFPGTDWLVRHLPGARMFEEIMSGFNEFVRRQIAARDSQLPPDAEPECLCDALLLEKRKAETAGDFETYKEMQLIRIVLEFFIAGTDTTARTLEWLLLLACFHPEQQRRLQLELDSQLERGRRPQMSDRLRLPYACAFIEETTRLVSLATLGVPHTAVRDCQFAGRRIPRGAFVMAFIYGCGHDPRLWPEPDTFKPERFLDEEGRFVGAGKNIPFLIGRRSCAGEGLARMEMFLMLTAILQRYTVRIADQCLADRDRILAGRQGLLRIPGEYRMHFELRE